MNNPTLWGMIHVPTLPGSGSQTKSFDEIKEFCFTDAKILFDNGINHFFIENFGDAPFTKNTVQPHVVASLTAIIEHIKSHLPDSVFGVNVLRNDALSALAIASTTGSQAIRVNVLTHARLTDQGIIEGCSYELIKYKHQLHSNTEIWADVDVKHSYPLATIPLEDAIHDTLGRGGADKVIFTGSRTGTEADFTTIKSLIENNIITSDKVVIGSGITSDNVHNFLPYAKNFIVGTSLKQQGVFTNHIDPRKVSKLVSAIS